MAISCFSLLALAKQSLSTRFGNLDETKLMTNSEWFSWNKPIVRSQYYNEILRVNFKLFLFLARLHIKLDLANTPYM